MKTNVLLVLFFCYRAISLAQDIDYKTNALVSSSIWQKNTIEQTIATQKQKASIATISLSLAKSPEKIFSFYKYVNSTDKKEVLCAGISFKLILKLERHKKIILEYTYPENLCT